VSEFRIASKSAATGVTRSHDKRIDSSSVPDRSLILFLDTTQERVCKPLEVVAQVLIDLTEFLYDRRSDQCKEEQTRYPTGFADTP